MCYTHTKAGIGKRVTCYFLLLFLHFLLFPLRLLLLLLFLLLLHLLCFFPLPRGWFSSWCCSAYLVSEVCPGVCSQSIMGHIISKTDSPSSSSYEIPRAPQLVVGFHVHLPPPSLNSVWLELKQVSLLWTLTGNCPVASGKFCFFDVVNHSLLLQFFCLLIHEDSWATGGGDDMFPI